LGAYRQTNQETDMYRPLRGVWALLAIGGAITVGVITHDPGFTALTFVGALVLPRVLGFGRHGHPHHGGGWAGGRSGACGGWRGPDESAGTHASANAGTAQV
jgi:hypothetical protein